MSGLLITGGLGNKTAAEVWMPGEEGGQVQCELPNMEVERWWHSQSGRLVCGGMGSRTCSELTPGGWRRLDLRLRPRATHMQWTEEETGNTFIMCGDLVGTLCSIEMITANNKLIAYPFEMRMRHNTG